MALDEINEKPRHPLSTPMIASWLESLRPEAERAEVKIANLRESQLHTPTVAADYDSDRAMGRISVWVTGEFDFEVLRITSGEHVFFRHESTIDFGVPGLLEAYSAFIRSMPNPDEKPA
jgi:hypothetical protein